MNLGGGDDGPDIENNHGFKLMEIQIGDREVRAEKLGRVS